MSMCLYVIVIGIIIFVGGVSQVIPEIFILIGLFVAYAGIAISELISEMNETRMKERIDRLEDKVKALEEGRKEDGSMH